MVQVPDSATYWALALSLCVSVGIGALIIVAILRRGQQILYFRYLHGLRKRYRGILAETLSGKRQGQGLDTLRRLPLRDLELLFDSAFSRRRVPRSHLVVMRSICTDLGLIQRWQQCVADRARANHRGSSRCLQRRAKSIRNLGILRHEPSWPLLVKALDDPRHDIQTAALRALGAIHVPESFPAILDCLHAAALGRQTSPSLAAVESALVCFDLRSSPLLEVSLRHPHREIRRVAADTLRVMTAREAALRPDFQLTQDVFSGEMAELLLRDLWRDSVAEVRAAAAEVIALLPGPRVSTVLYELLFDSEWQVRLRTVRALANSRHATDLLLLGIRDCLRDSHGLVRDAAIHTLITLGPRARQHLYEHFLITEDPNLRAQIVEAIERTGLLATLVEGYSGGAGGVEALMVEELASRSAPLGLSGVLQMANPPIREKFQERFLPFARFKMELLERTSSGANPPPDLQQILEFPPVLAA